MEGLWVWFNVHTWAFLGGIKWVTWKVILLVDTGICTELYCIPLMWWSLLSLTAAEQQPCSSVRKPSAYIAGKVVSNRTYRQRFWNPFWNPISIEGKWSTREAVVMHAGAQDLLYGRQSPGLAPVPALWTYHLQLPSSAVSRGPAATNDTDLISNIVYKEGYSLVALQTQCKWLYTWQHLACNYKTEVVEWFHPEERQDSMLKAYCLHMRWAVWLTK